MRNRNLVAKTFRRDCNLAPQIAISDFEILTSSSVGVRPHGGVNSWCMIGTVLCDLFFRALTAFPFSS
jgi:hypothetical protein